MGLKEQILGAPPIGASREIAIPEWGNVKVFVGIMTGTDRDAFDAENNALREAGDGLKNIRARMLVRCLRDESGESIFSAADAVELGKREGFVLDRLFDIAREVNHYGEANLKELEKNS